MIYLVCFLLLVVATLGYVVWNLLRKVERQEDVLVEYLTYIDGFSKAIDYSAKRLQQIDDRGTFKSDDEIGWFFDQILSLQAQLNSFRVRNIRIEDDEETKK